MSYRVGISLLGSLAIPHYGFGIALRNTVSKMVQITEAVLAGRISLFGGFARPLQTLGLIPCQPPSIDIHPG